MKLLILGALLMFIVIFSSSAYAHNLPDPCVHMLVNRTFSTRTAAVNYFLSQGFHNTAAYVNFFITGNHAPNPDSFTKCVAYQEHGMCEYRMEGLITQNNNVWEARVSDIPEPNPEILHYFSGGWWYGYVALYHQVFC